MKAGVLSISTIFSFSDKLVLVATPHVRLLVNSDLLLDDQFDTYIHLPVRQLLHHNRNLSLDKRKIVSTAYLIYLCLYYFTGLHTSNVRVVVRVDH